MLLHTVGKGKMRLLITKSTKPDDNINKSTRYTLTNNRFTVYHKGTQWGEPIDVQLGDIVYVNFTDCARTPKIEKCSKPRDQKIADLLGFSSQKQICKTEELFRDILDGQQNYTNLTNVVSAHCEGRYGFILGDITTHTDRAKEKGLPAKTQKNANIKIWINPDISSDEILELATLYSTMSNRNLSDEVLLALSYQ